MLPDVSFKPSGISYKIMIVMKLCIPDVLHFANTYLFLTLQSV
jgi:hypothetical protein